MLLDLREMSEAHARLQRTYAARAVDSGDADYAIAGDVRLVLDIQKDRDRCHLVGRVVARIEQPCCRCLEPFDAPVDVELDLLYVPRSRNTGAADAAIEDEDLRTAFYDDDQIDLKQLMREQLYLALPMKPLCAATCRGLCPECGTNLNRGTCRCARTWDDPRLASLKGLLGREPSD